MSPSAGSGPSAPVPPASTPYGPQIAAEHAGWKELQAQIHRLTPAARLLPGYYRDPDWSVKDLVAHVGTWLAEAEIQLERIGAGTYEGPPPDVDALNERFLATMRDQPWDVVSVQAAAARTQMLHEWYGLPAATTEASWWVRKSGAEHYGEHLGRLQEWVDELLCARGARPAG